LPADARNMKVKSRLPVPSIATSGRWHKRADGEWGFDLEDPPKDGESEVPVGQCGASDDEEDDGPVNDQKTINTNDNVNNQQNSDKKAPISDLSSKQSNKPINDETTSSSSSSSSSTSKVQPNSSAEHLPPIHLVLRMRDEKKELQDIKFDFLPNKDTVDEISHELVNAKLIDAIDMVAVSANLNKLLENSSISPITFQLV
jgi:serine/threonine-protein kinase OSR1/STK39